MTLRHTAGALVLAIASIIGFSQSAAAQTFDFLWGGGAEHGGGKQIVGFSNEYKPGQIIVSFTDRRLYHVIAQGQAMSYPVAVPKGEARWQGVTFVSQKRINPSWTPTPEMLQKNPRLPAWVPGGHPMNPLGDRALYLGSSAYRIHGTDAPWTIGQAVSHGCIRMLNQDVHDLYPKIDVGTRVTVTWQKFSAGAISSNSAAPSVPYSSRRSSGYDDNGLTPRKYYRPNPGQYRSGYNQRRADVL